MKKVNHINNMDSENRVYCRLLNKVVELGATHTRDYCSGCKMFAGSAQGRGVECEWEDHRDVSNPHVVNNPIIEFNHIITSEAEKGNK